MSSLWRHEKHVAGLTFDGELRKYGLTDKRVIDDVREHLLDSIRSGLERGFSVQAAECEAFSTFGSPGTVAAAFVEERNGMNNRFIAEIRGCAEDATAFEPDPRERTTDDLLQVEHGSLYPALHRLERLYKIGGLENRDCDRLPMRSGIERSHSV